MKRLIAPLALVVLALVPSAAQAAVRCVPAAAPGCDTSHATIATAVATAVNDDTIRIAAGSYVENVLTEKRLNFIGAGSGSLTSTVGATVIVAPPGGAPLMLNGGGTVRSIQLQGGSSLFGGSALMLSPAINGNYSYALEDVVAVGGDSTDMTIGISGSGLVAFSTDSAKAIDLTVRDSDFEGGSTPSFFTSGAGAQISGPAMTANVARSLFVAPAGASTAGTGLAFSAGATATVTDSTARGGTGAQIFDGKISFERSRLESSNGGFFGATGLFAGDFDPAVVPTTTVTARDSLIVATPSVDAANAYGAIAQTTSAASAVDVQLIGSTVVARGIDPEGAVHALRFDDASPAASVTLRNSVARLEGPVEAGEGDLVSDRGSIAASTSSFSTVATANGGTTSTPGADGNRAGDPQLEADLAPAVSSPLVDAGDQALVLAGELDFAGAARSLDGNGDCVARPDIGAIERPAIPGSCAPPPVPPVADETPPSISALSLLRKRFTSRKPVHKGRKRGTTVRFTLSEAARVTIAFQRKLVGRRVRRNGRPRCVRPTRANASRPKCQRFAKAVKLRFDGKAGANARKLSGRVAGRPLSAGSYRATLTAIDAAGNRSKPARVSLRVLRP